jgi:O-antigen/teichoic acid export membrane protein
MGIIIRQSLKASLSNYIGVIIGFASLIYFFPKFFTPSELGAVRLLIELGAIIGAFGLFGTTYSINRFFPYFKNPPHHNGFFFWVFSIPLLGFAIISFNYFFFEYDFIKLFKSKDAHLIEQIYPMLIFLILGVMGQMVLESASANHGRIAVPNFLREILIRAVLLTSAGLFYLRWISFDMACWSVAIAYLLAFLGNLLYLRTLTPIRLKPDFNFLKENPSIKKDGIRFTAWLFISSAAALFISKVDFLMVSATKSLSDTAIYSIGFYIAVLIEIPKRNITQIATPIIAEHAKNKNLTALSALYKQMSSTQFLIGSLLFLLLWTNADTLFDFMPNGEFYRSGKTVIFIIGSAKVLEMIFAPVSPIINNSPFYFWNFVTAIFSIISAVSLNYWLIPLYGINGAAIATLITSFVMYGLSAIVVQIYWKINPFHKTQLISLALLIMGIGISIVPLDVLGNFWGNSLKTIAIIILFIMAIYKTSVSPEVKNGLQKILNF